MFIDIDGKQEIFTFLTSDYLFIYFFCFILIVIWIRKYYYKLQCMQNISYVGYFTFVCRDFCVYFIYLFYERGYSEMCRKCLLLHSWGLKKYLFVDWMKVDLKANSLLLIWARHFRYIRSFLYIVYYRYLNARKENKRSNCYSYHYYYHTIN